MTRDEVMARLEALGSESIRKMNTRNGAPDNQFGLRMGDIRVIAKEIKLNPELAEELWATGNIDAMFLAILLMKPKLFTTDDLDRLIRSVTFSHLADWLISYVIKAHPQKEQMREGWMNSDHPMAARAGWSLTAEKAAKDPQSLDPKTLLDRLEREMGSADPLVQWTMNYALAEIGINFPEHRERAIAIGEKLGVYRDYPVSKGCTSPFAPIWIDFMVNRQTAGVSG